MGAITAEIIDTGQRRDAKGRKVTERVRRLELVEEYRGSGLTMAEYVRREGLNYSTFAGWVAKTSRAVGGAIRFAEVRMPGTGAGTTAGGLLEVRLADGTVLRGGDAGKLAALIKALRN